MSKASSGLFSNTKGALYSREPNLKDPRGIKVISRIKVMYWAENKRNELTGKAKKNFNTAAVVYDESTGMYYYGRNGGYHEKGYVRNPILFGNDVHKGLLPTSSLNNYPVGNCAEVDAFNRALNAGAKLSNLHLTTVHVTKNRFGEYKPSCENCTYAFKGRVKKNYSGWVDK